MKKNPIILVVIDEQSDNDWAALEGIADYNQQDAWLIRIAELHQDLPRIIPSLKPDGLIYTARTEAANALDLPKVALFKHTPEKGLFSVEIHQENAGKLAAEFFVNKGYRHLAFITGIMQPRSMRRFEGFRATAEALGRETCFFENPCGQGIFPYKELQEYIDQLGKWLDRQPRPLGICTVNDSYALHVLEACRQYSIKVPEEVAVLGADNNRRLCAIAHPSLSSIQLPYKQLGFEAARLLDAQLRRKSPATQHVALDPSGIVERNTTEILAIQDEAVVKAFNHIRQHRTEPIRIPDVVRASGVSRTLLQRKFQKALQRTPLEEVHRQKIELAIELLRITTFNMDEIAEKCGLADQAQFTKLFRKKTGTTPSAFRKTCTLSNGANFQ